MYSIEGESCFVIENVNRCIDVFNCQTFSMLLYYILDPVLVLYTFSTVIYTFFIRKYIKIIRLKSLGRKFLYVVFVNFYIHIWPYLTGIIALKNWLNHVTSVTHKTFLLYSCVMDSVKYLLFYFQIPVTYRKSNNDDSFVLCLVFAKPKVRN